MMDAARYSAPGPVGKAFQRSDALVRGIMGPVGSGKTSLCLMEALRRGIKQRPSLIERAVDGRPVRMSRFVFLRDTYRNLERTTIPTWLEWVPRDAGEGMKGGASGEPGKHVLPIALPDGTLARIEILFIALGDASIEDVYRGFPMTGIYLNEADRIHIDGLKLGMTRVGRYPAMRHGGPTWKGVWCDFNAPNWGDDIEKVFISEKHEKVDFFKQPGGFDEGAENLEQLPHDYYQQQVETAPDHYWINRMVHNKIGYSRDGKPVYEEYDDNRHVSPINLRPVPRRIIYIGADGGTWPAAVFCDLTPERQIRVLAELVMENVGATLFARHLEEFAAEHFPQADFIGASDPSADNPTETSNEDMDAWVDIVSRVSKIKFKGTFSNKRLDREEGLRERLMNDVAPKVPGILIDPRCTILRKGLQFQFQYKAMKVGGGKYHEKPDKNEYSHCCEAFEYAVQRMLGKGVIRARQARREARRQLPKQVQYRATGY